VSDSNATRVLSIRVKDSLFYTDAFQNTDETRPSWEEELTEVIQQFLINKFGDGVTYVMVV